MTAFQIALRAAMTKSKTEAKRDGTTAMSVDNWRQVTRPPSPSLAGAPNGTNAIYYYRQMFAEMAAGDSFLIK